MILKAFFVHRFCATEVKTIAFGIVCVSKQLHQSRCFGFFRLISNSITNSIAIVTIIKRFIDFNADRHSIDTVPYRFFCVMVLQYLYRCMSTFRSSKSSKNVHYILPPLLFIFCSIPFGVYFSIHSETTEYGIVFHLFSRDFHHKRFHIKFMSLWCV